MADRYIVAEVHGGDYANTLTIIGVYSTKAAAIARRDEIVKLRTTGPWPRPASASRRVLHVWQRVV